MAKRVNNNSQNHNMPPKNNNPNMPCLKTKSLLRLLFQNYALKIFLHTILAKILKNIMSKNIVLNSGNSQRLKAGF